MSDSIAVTALGLVTAVGYSAVASCAAARAGMSLPWKIGSIAVEDPLTAEPEPIIGHAVRGLTDGYSGGGRLLRLAARALSDLNDDLGRVPLGTETRLFLCLPSSWAFEERERRVRKGELPARDTATAVDAHYPRPAERGAVFRSDGAARMLRFAGVEGSPEVEFLEGGETGLVEAIRRGAELLGSGAAKRCIVGGVDSWVEDESLQVAADLGLLKSAANPVGFMPGEAAGFVSLELAQTAKSEGRTIRARLEAPAIAREPFDRCSGEPGLGVALSQCISASLQGSGRARGGVAFVVGSLNGDSYRAQDWAIAAQRLRTRPSLGEVPHWRPVGSFGQIGAAQGAANAAICVRAFDRGYAPGPAGLVWLSSDRGDRGSFVVSAAS